MNINPLIPLLISITALVTLFAIYLTIFFIIHKNKQRKNILEKTELKHAYESQLLNSKLEIQEETLNRVSMEIHDNICQSLGALHYQWLAIHENPAQIGMLKESGEILTTTIDNLRNISHTLN